MSQGTWKLNQLEYFEAPGLSALAFNNKYPEGKQGGIEIIQHDARVAANGDLRLEIVPGQWASLPQLERREVDQKNGRIEAFLQYPEVNLRYSVRVWTEKKAIRLAVDLAEPLPAEWIGKISFNLELFPDALFGTTFSLGDTCAIFPRQAGGPMRHSQGGTLEPLPLATGKKLTAAPEDPFRRLVIESVGGELELYDGRNVTQNSWYVIRSVVHGGKTKNAIEWAIVPNAVPGWQREPVICLSQVGYHPKQMKQAIIELDPRTEQPEEAALCSVLPDGELRKVFSARPRVWGQFLRYRYAIFDFTSVTTPGMYIVRYSTVSSLPIKIAADVFQKDVWQPTLETFFPVQMCHMEVRDKYRVWHGTCHLDDAIQAPTSHVHFDNYRQGPTTDTTYKPFTHIPGLDRGGWHDAGDYDLAAGSQAWTTLFLAMIRETFGIDTDQTTVHRQERLVILGSPDGTPDIIQQIVHGVENLLSGYHVSGHSYTGIIAGTLEQYVHLGDACTMTDNLVYDPSLKPEEAKEGRSGKRDDRWVFTNHDTSLEYLVIGALAAAARVLKGFEDKLAEECLTTALAAWRFEQSHTPAEQKCAYVPGRREAMEALAASELLITTGEKAYGTRLRALLEEIPGEDFGWAAGIFARTLPLVNDDSFTADLRKRLVSYKEEREKLWIKNPFGVPYIKNIWGVGWIIQRFALQEFFLQRAFPDLFEVENILRAVNYALGCHPASNLSLVSGVGAQSVMSAYGVNRAEYSYIPGGNVSGPSLIEPDFPELKAPFPYLWQQTEYVISGAASYIFCVLAADKLLNG